MFMKNGGEDLRCGEHLIRPLPTLSRLALLLDDLMSIVRYLHY